MEYAQVHVFITGRVQGVGFRQWTADVCRRSGVEGWVRNLPDGRVEALLEGTRTALDGILDELRRGPNAAHVDACAPEWGQPEGLVGFQIRPTPIGEG